MYKGKRKVLMKVLSLALAAGMSVSGLPVSALAAETADAEVQEESVVETETATEPAVNKETCFSEFVDIFCARFGEFDTDH